jgi:erythritol transport system ATP-binding protein
VSTAATSETDAPVLEARKVTKIFGGTTALREVDFRLEHSRVHALVGENGAGKSTLVKILAGVETPTRGTLLLGGRQIALRSTRDAAGSGIALIHQELQLFPDLSIAENLFVGRERLSRWGAIDRAAQVQQAREALAMLGVGADPRTPVGAWSLGVQQIVEIARALVHDTRVLLMDEPTSALSPTEVRALFGIIRDLAARGVSIVYVSHRLQEVLAVADSVTVLRDGRIVGSAPASSVNLTWLVERMTGRSASAGRPTETAPSTRRTVLGVRDLNLAAGPGHAALHEISFALQAGEVVGIYGLMGAGRTELLESLIGVHADATGSVELGGVRIDTWPADRRVAAGLAIVPEDRQRAGLVPTLSVLHNMTLSSLGRLGRLGWVSRSREVRAGRQYSGDVQLRTPGIDAPVAALSGGNQQKVVIARALMSHPRVLLMDEPSRGVDVAARADIIACMRRLAGAGMAIVFTSSDLDEILAAATRVLVLARGRLTAEFAAGDATEAAIAAAASTAVQSGKAGERCESQTVH